MCGIVGAMIFDQSDYLISSEYINRMRDTMVNRGPDQCNHWISKNKKIGFGHRRLSIIDLSDSAIQPMTSQDGTLVISFNGEIYNHAEIREELNKKGKYNWQTSHSDTEVILNAFLEWGIQCVDRFRGMFAFAIWDKSSETLWLARDRMGIKPLYYSLHNNRLVFASEIKALLQDPDQRKELDETSLFHYLSFLTAPAPHTLFKGIKKIPNATWIKFSQKGDYSEVKYWDALDNTRDDIPGMNEEEVAQELLKELKTSIDYRKVGDVPMGVFLSGGIDSSANAALFSSGENNKTKTFSIGYAGKYKTYSNELGFAKQAADHANAEYHEKILDVDDLINFLPQMIRLQDEPIADPVCIPLYYVSKLARENNVTVCQVGEGADELFWGYPYWKKVLKLQNFSEKYIPQCFLSLAVKFLNFFKLNTDWRYEAIRRVSLNQPIYWGPEPFTHNQKLRFLSDSMKEKFKDQTSWESIKHIRNDFNQKSKSNSNLDWMSYIDLNLRLPELLLMRVDKMSMGVSLEARVPFLDHIFVELAMSIPESLKTKNGTLKYILKKALRGVIPDEIIDRKKQGFTAPINEWSEKELGEFGKKQLQEFCKETDYFSWEEIESFYNQRKGLELWPLLNLAMWWNEFIREDAKD